MEAFVIKMAGRIPQLLTRAAAGDVVAIAELVVTGGVALALTVKNK